MAIAASVLHAEPHKYKKEYQNTYPSRVFQKNRYVKVQSFSEFLFGGFVRPFTGSITEKISGKIYDDIQRMYPGNRKTQKVNCHKINECYKTEILLQY